MMEIDWLDLIKWIIGIGTIFIPIYYTIKHFKIVRTVSYIERFNNVSMLQTREIIDEWHKLSRKKKIDKLKKDKKIYFHIHLLYNLLTEVAIAYKKRILNKKLIREIFDPLIPEYWLKIEPFIIESRKEGREIGYNLEFLNNEILKKRRKTTHNNG